MFVSGFTFIKNGVLYDYPFVESIKSLLPIVDEMIVLVGDSNDNTLEMVKSINSQKIRIHQSIWDENLRQNGEILAQQTNLAKSYCDPRADWLFYIQGDELISEADYDSIEFAMQKHKENKGVDGLLFDYIHFYASYNWIGDEMNWYPKEIRIIRNDSSIYSYGDAQGFRKGNNKKLRVKPANGKIYHYGWVKDPKAMTAKQKEFQKLWHSDEWIEEKYPEGFKISLDIALHPFVGKHPELMWERVNLGLESENIKISSKLPLRYRLKKYLKKYLGIDTSYKNYIEI